MKTCDKCVHYSPSKTMKNIGPCQVPVPYWVAIEFDAVAFVAAGNTGVAPLCKTYTEKQQEECISMEEHWKICYDAAVEKNQELEEKLYHAKVQQDLYRHIVDGYDRG